MMSDRANSRAAGIAVAGVTKGYDGHTIMADLNVVFEPGELTVVLGPSGCGKSTLLRIVAGLEPVTHGRILIGGEDVTLRPPGERGCSMVFQHYALYPHMSVSDNIGYALTLAGLPRTERQRRIADAASMLGLTELLKRRPDQLSGGQRQRVAIARAIARQPAILLFDEALSNLDAKLRHEMRMELRRLHKEIGGTTIFVTHDQTEAMTLADRIVVMNRGCIEQIGTPGDIYHRPRTPFVASFIGSPPMNLLEATRAPDGGAVLPDGTALPLVERALPGDNEAGGARILVGIRPEAFVVRHDASGLQCTLEAIEDLGSHRLLYCRLGRQRIIATQRDAADYRTGDRLSLGYRPEHVTLFDAAMGAGLTMPGFAEATA
ncbi:carbohydrate ABC transporter ATP-binding protein (CUT1 family) [Paraburkholderia sp. BL6669N2]|uniref:ABC transporter ATP-binding protein n=1 Tax=Paraburkholderia sp. BL6669N2 TaxID=1938807 RepID=UPI000E276938|nr:sn-glycerol-3-phosphate ABC transporter ATP-binding protein UgpC [Paraburkholderia sp. BL6669N2]REG58606.1 carbohydrate ABC transporter ATP-binding protein (CUT1 family) [Paraburkholderia sp. BL6669N2]